MPSVNDVPSVSTEDKVHQVWNGCAENTGVFTHLCLYNQLISFTEATVFSAGFTAPPNTLVLVNFPERNAFVVNGNQVAVEGVDYYRITGAQTGLSSTYLTINTVTTSVSGKQIVLGQTANPYTLFPGWPQWPPVLPTQFVIQTPGPVQPSATPNIIPPPFTSADFLNLWYSMTPEKNITMLLDEAYGKWGMYGGEFTTVTYSFIPAGSIIWSVSPSNIVDLSKQPFEPINECFSVFNEGYTVVYTVCDIYVVNPPFKFLTLKDWRDFKLGMLPAVPLGIHPFTINTFILRSKNRSR